ncbi:hypothetical protein ADM96_37555 [Burkholderia sp. ST111]|nr:hypothetical protein ADM96_37555 [Burkholderia sp. ST111]
MGLTLIARVSGVALCATSERRWKALLRCRLLLPCALLCACGTSPTQDDGKIATQDEAATVRVSAIMVAPWQEVQSVLQPNFTMSGDAAASDVLPTTSRIQDQLLNAVAASLGIGLPQSSKQGTSTSTSSSSNNSSTAAGVTTVTSNLANGVSTTSTTTTAPGVIPAVPSGVPAGTQSLTPAANAGTLGIDPELRYKAANYLNEQVQLLNKEVQYASAQKCMVPYVVKLRIAVMLHKPRIAYSAHTFVSFFNEDAPKARAAQIAAAASEATMATEASDDACQAGPLVVPTVVPLLAADNINVALKSNTAEMATQLGFALSLMEHGVGASGNLGYLKQAIHSISDQEMSSTLTVTMQSTNTLYARIAPNNEYDDPALIGETYDIAVLLLVPRGYFNDAPTGNKSSIDAGKTMRAPTKDKFSASDAEKTKNASAHNDSSGKPVKIELAVVTQLRDAKNGEVLNIAGEDALANAFDKFVKKWVSVDPAKIAAWDSLSPQEKQDISRPLVQDVEIANLSGFYEQLDTVGPPAYTCPTTMTKSAASTVATSEVAARAIPQHAPHSQNETQVGESADDDHSKQGVHKTRSPCFFDSRLAFALWNDLALALATVPNINTDFQVPRASNLTIPPQQDALVLDDGKQNAQVTLYNVGGTSAAGFGAYLTIAPASAQGNTGKPVNLAVQSMTLDPIAHTLTLTFPSPQKWGLRTSTPAPQGQTPPKADKRGKAIKVAQTPTNADALYIFASCTDSTQLCPEYDGPLSMQAHIVTSASDAAAGSPDFKVTQGSNVIDEANDGKGVMSIVISGLKPQKNQPAASVAVTVTGADVGLATDSAGTALTLGDNGYVIRQNGTYTFNLFNLSPGAKVTATAQQMKSAASGTSAKVGAPATATYSVISLASEARR